MNDNEKLILLLDAIVDNLVNIDKEILTKSEYNISLLLVDNKFARWEINSRSF